MDMNGKPFVAESYGAGSFSGLSYTLRAGGDFEPPATHTLVTLLDRYGDTLWEGGKHKANVVAFIHDLYDMMPEKEFSGFSQDMLDRLVNALRKRGNSNATINRKMSALSKLLRKAHKIGDIHVLPDFTRQKERAGRVRFLEHDEEVRLFAAIAARNELYQRLCIFLVDSGARLGEALGLRWNDLQGSMATFWITKSGRSRSVPLTTRARKAIGHATARGLGPFSGIDQQQFRTVWKAAKQDAGFLDDPDLVPHVLRHTCASRLVRGGIDIRRVQMWLGHQTLQMTMRYAHLASHDLDLCVPVLERASQKASMSTRTNRMPQQAQSEQAC
ncbi:tyrosine-type recombinase/integrase [Rhizobium sp. 9140]|uniref:tyrosine-type recombinase/integrase n=1 Tax=Rhizobium sp. 9140 TaxID=1761900 RepID=UPI0007934F35|nr:site-specific integrase [Rhizobium sp. 9140]CZT34640.1 Site-specific recombinase XerD [Rhizobium sp. 9140]